MKRVSRIFGAAAVVLCFATLAYAPASAQGVEVTPVNVQMAPGQMAAALTITNENTQKISFQIRGFTWQQDAAGEDVLGPTDELLSSPPIATIQPGASQVVRLILRHPPEGREATYRIIFDQLPPPREAGVINVLVRLSIPIFAEPQARLAPQVHWRVAKEAGRWWLIASNSGTRHLTVSGIRLETSDGRALQVEMKSPPHILAGATKRWPIAAGAPLSANEVVRLTGRADVGEIDQRISLDAGP